MKGIQAAASLALTVWLAAMPVTRGIPSGQRFAEDVPFTCELFLYGTSAELNPTELTLVEQTIFSTWTLDVLTHGQAAWGTWSSVNVIEVKATAQSLKELPPNANAVSGNVVDFDILGCSDCRDPAAEGTARRLRPQRHLSNTQDADSQGRTVAGTPQSETRRGLAPPSSSQEVPFSDKLCSNLMLMGQSPGGFQGLSICEMTCKASDGSLFDVNQVKAKGLTNAQTRRPPHAGGSSGEQMFTNQNSGNGNAGGNRANGKEGGNPHTQN